MKPLDYNRHLDNEIYEYLSTPIDIPTLGDLQAQLARYTYMYNRAIARRVEEELIVQIDKRIQHLAKIIEGIKKGDINIPRQFSIGTAKEPVKHLSRKNHKTRAVKTVKKTPRRKTN